MEPVLASESKMVELEKPISDEEQLTALGHVQELRREFSLWSIVCLQISLMATWEALSSVVTTALTNGGAPCLFYNYIIALVGTIFIVLSLGEIASVYPTAGGWISIGGQLVFSASAAFAAGLQFQALITLNNLDSYTPTRWQGMLFYWLILAYSTSLNIWGSTILPHTNTAAGVLHVVGFVGIVIVLGVLPPKHTTNYVFTEFSNTSGWNSDGVSWLVGLLSTVYPFLGYDAACHLSEELPKPSRNVPLAMIGSVTINGVIGLVYAIVLLFSLGDLESLLQSKTGFPFIQLFLDVTKSRAGASIMTLCVTFIATAANAACVTSTSRTAWAFARDRGLPASQFLSTVHPTLRVPVHMVLVVGFLQMLLGLIYLGSSTAFNAVLSMAILGMYASYLSPIIFMLIYGRRNSASIVRGLGLGSFNLGPRWGPVVNIVAIMWLFTAMVFSTFPTLQPVTPENMNYCIVVTMGWMMIGGAYFYIFGGKQRFSGPVIELAEDSPFGGTSAGYEMWQPYDESKPTLLMINAFTMTSELYRPQFEDDQLSKAMNMLAIEPLGHGRTSTMRNHWTYWDTAEMNLQVLDALGIEKAFVLGTSQGGFDPGDDYCDAVVSIGLNDCSTEVRELWRGIIKATYQGEDGRRRIRMAAINLAERDGLRLRLPDVVCPVHWIHGTKDAVFSVRNAEEEIQMFTGSSNAQLTTIEDGAHFLSASHPSLVNAAVLNFVVNEPAE
ncbi:Amino acid/polyamine transporter I [Penicillium brevicompactum]|uniref:Amino acid/polyamine transporter I n=1 Tax=Penicillium brevicompactum TaxID=5074 RepID=A0A9W9RJ31_PENBR|nr:Amino acid/polyamine transporter I [Penicillium brevicompactum]